MNGLIFEDSNGRWSFIPTDAVVKITEKNDGSFHVWYAKGYTNADATLSKDELEIRSYEQYLNIVLSK